MDAEEKKKTDKFTELSKKKGKAKQIGGKHSDTPTQLKNKSHGEKKNFFSVDSGNQNCQDIASVVYNAGAAKEYNSFEKKYPPPPPFQKIPDQ